MSIVFLPVFKLAVGYTVSYGRRWSVLEHLVLVKLATERLSVSELVKLAGLPERLIIEGLINLLRAGWIEVRTTDLGVHFSTTAAGKRRAKEQNLPVELRQRLRWIALCVDRITGAWLRADDLDLVYERDLPSDAVNLEPRITTLNPDDETRRGLVYLDRDESFERFAQIGRSPARALARLEVAFDQIKGLPSYAPRFLQDVILSEVPPSESTVAPSAPGVPRPFVGPDTPVDTLTAADLIIGGPEHLALVRESLARARSHAILHSCFIQPKAVEMLLQDFEVAARRKVRIDLLWGLRADAEDKNIRVPSITAVQQVLDRLNAGARSYVQLSPVSSGSHAKVIIYDDQTDGVWNSIVGSCNFLSSLYDTIEVSLRCRSRRLAAQIIGYLIAAQLPTSGGWSPVAHRLNRIWNDLRLGSENGHERGTHTLELLVDDDHYACVRTARNEGRKSIVIGCDIYGLSAETAVLPPMERAAELGASVRLLYRRPSRFLIEQGRTPESEVTRVRQVGLDRVAGLHGKFLVWDDAGMAITSFNWMSTVADGARLKGAELGVLVRGPSLRNALAERMNVVSGGRIQI